MDSKWSGPLIKLLSGYLDNYKKVHKLKRIELTNELVQFEINNDF